MNGPSFLLPSRRVREARIPAPGSAPASYSQLLPLPPQVPRHLLEDILEHCPGAEMRRLVECAIALGLAAGLPHFVRDFALELRLPLQRPFPETDQMPRQPVDRVAIGPLPRFVLGTVA